MQSDSNKIVVITGASSGVGRATALAFARQGNRLVLAARREPALEEVAQQCREEGAEATVAICDVTQADAVQELAEKAVAIYGGIDVWVNNAGVLAAGAFDETPVAVHSHVVQTNLLGYIHGAHAALTQFKIQGFGILINNISVGGWMATPYAAAYTASKWGLRGLGSALRGELHRFPHIHVCDLFPAFLDTPGIQHAANYTGRYLQPAPPIFDPQKVAAAIERLSQHPKPSTIIDFAAPLLKVAYSLAPQITTTATAMVMERYMKVAPRLPNTPGNVLEPMEAGTSIHGGWNSQADAQNRKQKGLLLLAGVVLGVALLRRL